MKNCFFLLIILFCSLQNYAQDFIVENANIDIFLNRKDYFDVKENYQLFFSAPKHGIYRTIRTQYDFEDSNGNKQKRKIKISKIDVPGYKFKAPMGFVQKLESQTEIKIGDPNRTVEGLQKYQINYRVSNSYIFENSKIQFYWNVKPDAWQTEFHQLNFSVHLPKGVSSDLQNIFVYSGNAGDNAVSTEFDISYQAGVFHVKSKEGFKSYPGQSVTVLLNLPPEAIKENVPLWPFWDKYGWTLLIGCFLIGFYLIWKKYGKDDAVIANISYFPPSGVDPAMAGFLINDNEDTSDLISLIPYWGSKGLIRMEHLAKKGWFGKDDTKLVQLKPLSIDAPAYEKEIFQGLFGADTDIIQKEILISSLKETFYTTMSSAKSQLRKNAQIYYLEKSKNVKLMTTIMIVVLCIIFAFLFLVTWGIMAAVAMVVTSGFLLFMNTYMVKKNNKGNEVFADLLGFKQFIKVAEENRLKMLLHDSPNYFETTMGYALTFGLFDQWAKKFEALDLEPPSWYSSSTGIYTMHSFANSFSSAMITTQSTMVSAPSSSGGSGGGSSGGGFGGGGGGSW